MTLSYIYAGPTRRRSEGTTYQPPPVDKNKAVDQEQVSMINVLEAGPPADILRRHKSAVDHRPYSVAHVIDRDIDGNIDEEVSIIDVLDEGPPLYVLQRSKSARQLPTSINISPRGSKSGNLKIVLVYTIYYLVFLDPFIHICRSNSTS